MNLKSWRKSKGWSQAELGSRLGLESKGHVSRLESGVGVTTDIAIAMDRLSEGQVTVADLRPDLSDVCVIQKEARA
jgi:transcriptional regulator with XRE-family HTH domain